MATSTPNIEQINYYRVLHPKGFEDLLFSPTSPRYLRYHEAVAFPQPPFVLSSPEEAVARCIALNSHNWEVAKRGIEQGKLLESLDWQATRGLAVYHLQDGKPVLAVYAGRDPKLNVALSHPELMGNTVSMKEVRGVLRWAEKHNGLVEPVGRLELSVQEDNGKTLYGQHPVNQAIFGKDMAEGYAFIRRSLDYKSGITRTINEQDIGNAGVTANKAALRWVGVGFDYVGADRRLDYVGRACGVAQRKKVP